MLRVARVEDVPALRELIVASVRGLQTAEYSDKQIEGDLGTVYGTDRTMISDGTFFVLEDAPNNCWPRRLESTTHRVWERQTVQ